MRSSDAVGTLDATTSPPFPQGFHKGIVPSTACHETVVAQSLALGGGKASGIPQRGFVRVTHGLSFRQLFLAVSFVCHGIGNFRQDWIRFVQLIGEVLDHLLCVRFPLDVAARLCVGRVLHGLAHFNGQKESQKIAYPESSTPRSDLEGTSSLVDAFGTYALDEFKERCLVTGLPLQDVGRKDLEQQILTLNVHQNLIPDNPQVCGFAQMVAQQTVQIAVP